VGGIAPRAVLTYEEPESLAVFVQGRAVFMRNWPYAWEVLNDPERSRVAGRVSVSELPHAAGQVGAAALGGWQFGISSFSQRKELAWTFVEFMTSPEMQRHFAVTASLAPTRRALYSDPRVLEANPQLADQAAAFSLATPRPVTPLYPAVSSVLQRTFSEILAGDVDAAAAARRADSEIDALLELAPSTP
jgi:multiple sugar transport system substrate-binding protein